jgi:hypothetical protein
VAQAPALRGIAGLLVAPWLPKQVPAGDAGSESASYPEELSLIDEPVDVAEEPRLGPTLPEDLKLFMEHTWLGQTFDEHGVRVYGWLDAGYTYATTGPGPLTVETRENRFGNEALLNQMALVVEKPLDPTRWSFGYNVTFWAGADAALLRPRGGFDTDNPRFGADFRQLYVSAHLPVLSEGGVDVKLGRQSTILGYESALAPYRPFYSNSYEWFYSTDFAWTGILANWHVTRQLDLLSGITTGANTFFTLRGSGPCYIGQVNYWPHEGGKTLLSASILVGDQAIFAAPGLAGSMDTVVELRVQHDWGRHLTQIVQCDMGWDQNVPNVGVGSWYGLYNIFVVHMNERLDLNLRGEWFDDVQGTRTGFATHYEEATVGVDYHPYRWVRLRPEVRGDFANDLKVFGKGRDQAQLTAAFECLFQF